MQPSERGRGSTDSIQDTSSLHLVANRCPRAGKLGKLRETREDAEQDAARYAGREQVRVFGVKGVGVFWGG